MNNNFKSKYLKYKKKYLELKRKKDDILDKMSDAKYCPCKEYSGKDQDDHTCYITNLNEKKTEQCSYRQTKQASIFNYKRWYRKCYPDIDDNCPTKSNPLKVNNILENTEEQLKQAEKQAEDYYEKLAPQRLAEKEYRENNKRRQIERVKEEIEPTLNGRILLLQFMKPEENIRTYSYHKINLTDRDKSSYPFTLVNDVLLDKAVVFSEAYRKEEKERSEFERTNGLLGDSGPLPLFGKLENKKLTLLNDIQLEEMHKAAIDILRSPANKYSLKKDRETQHLRDIVDRDYREWKRRKEANSKEQTDY